VLTLVSGGVCLACCIRLVRLFATNFHSLASVMQPGVRFFNSQGPKKWSVWVVENHWDHEQNRPTPTGQLTRQAKYGFDRTAAEQLAQNVAAVATFLASKNRFGDEPIEAVCAVPFAGSKQLSVPHLLAEAVAKAIRAADRSHLVTKVKETDPAKLQQNPVVDPTLFRVEWNSRARRVLLIDDVFRSGATLESLHAAFRQHGIEPVGAICATRAHKGMALS